MEHIIPEIILRSVACKENALTFVLAPIPTSLTLRKKIGWNQNDYVEVFCIKIMLGCTIGSTFDLSRVDMDLLLGTTYGPQIQIRSEF